MMMTICSLSWSVCRLFCNSVFITVKDYTYTSKSNLSSAITWSVNIIRHSQKIHRCLEMTENNSIRSCPHMQLWHTCVFGQVPTPRIIHTFATEYLQILWKDTISPSYATISVSLFTKHVFMALQKYYPRKYVIP